MALLQNIIEQSVWPILLAESLKALGGLGLLSLGGKYFIRRVFEVCYLLHSEIHAHILFNKLLVWYTRKTELSFSQFVAESRSSEAFVALCLLTVAGTSLITQKLGFSDTVCSIRKFQLYPDCALLVFWISDCLPPDIILCSWVHFWLEPFLQKQISGHKLKLT